MKRGEIWTVAGRGEYAGKPRPVVIVQDDRFDATASITVCAFTTDPTPAPLFRLNVEPNESNGLKAQCSLMVDKVTTVPKSKIGRKIGRLDDEHIVRLNRAMLVFLGLAGGSSEGRRSSDVSGKRSERASARQLSLRTFDAAESGNGSGPLRR